MGGGGGGLCCCLGLGCCFVVVVVVLFSFFVLFCDGLCLLLLFSFSGLFFFHNMVKVFWQIKARDIMETQLLNKSSLPHVGHHRHRWGGRRAGSCVVEGRKEGQEMLHLTTHSTHFDLRLYGVTHMVKDLSE